ncbi:DUF6281 family protein [Streptomyces sp. NPDC001914]|uniref:DUF6281 family protein n=1 Tax=Streptomyces sp. NPDC001914 TaxID=3364623 RepID=UPI00367C995F
MTMKFRIRRLGVLQTVLATSFLIPTVACTATGSSEDGAVASCAFSVQYRGKSYTEVTHDDFTLGAKIGTVKEVPCNDTGDSAQTGAKSESYTAYEITELDAETAIAVKDFRENPDREDGLHLYVLHGEGGYSPEAKKFLDSAN